MAHHTFRRLLGRNTPWRVFVFLALMGCILIPLRGACAESVDTKRITKSTLDALQSHFLMSEALAIIKASRNRSASKAYLRSHEGRFGFAATQQQPPMVMDAYTVLDLTSPIIGYSLFYYGADGPLALLDAAVSPLVKDAVGNASKLISQSLDSLPNPDGSKTYFLGIYDVDSAGILKIMVRKGQTSMGTEYHIQYVVQIRYSDKG